MFPVETGQMSAVETGQMTAAETSVLFQQKTSGPEACQDRSRAFGTGLTHSKGRPWPSPGGRSRVPMSVRVQIIENGREWVENRPFGAKIE